MYNPLAVPNKYKIEVMDSGRYRVVVHKVFTNILSLLVRFCTTEVSYLTTVTEVRKVYKEREGTRVDL